MPCSKRAVRKAQAEDPEIAVEITLADSKDAFMVPADAKLVGYIGAAWERVMKRPPVLRGASWLGDTASFG